MDVHASLNHLRMAPRKVRLIVDLIRGLKVADAETRLLFSQREAARPVLKLLKSAIANAEHNFKLDPATLVVKTISVDGGVTLKRHRPRAMGRAAPIRKRTSHINLTLAPASEVKLGKKAAKKVAAIARAQTTPKKKASSKKKAPATTTA